MTKDNSKKIKQVKIERKRILKNIANARLQTIKYYQDKLTKEEWMVIDELEKKALMARINRSSSWIEIAQDVLTENLIDALLHYFNFRFKKTKDQKRFVKVKEGMKFYLIQKKYGKLF